MTADAHRVHLGRQDFLQPPLDLPLRVEDPLRVAYLREHIAAVGKAIERGAKVKGYMLWSLFDNLEWSLGYSKRFGIIHVNFETQERTLKDSAKLYSEVIATNGACLG